MRQTQTTRRTLLAGAGAAGLAALAGCTVYGNESAPPPPSPPSGGAPGGAPDPGATGGGAQAAPGIANVGDIPVGAGTIFPDQQIVVTQPTAGTFACFGAVCTHQGCIVTDVSGGTINCPCHGSRFNVADGSVAGGPAPLPLPPVGITVDGDTIRRA